MELYCKVFVYTSSYEDLVRRWSRSRTVRRPSLVRRDDSMCRLPAVGQLLR